MDKVTARTLNRKKEKNNISFQLSFLSFYIL